MNLADVIVVLLALAGSSGAAILSKVQHEKVYARLNCKAKSWKTCSATLVMIAMGGALGFSIGALIMGALSRNTVV